jgi:hypothetical protein
MQLHMALDILAQKLPVQVHNIIHHFLYNNVHGTKNVHDVSCAGVARCLRQFGLNDSDAFDLVTDINDYYEALRR